MSFYSLIKFINYTCSLPIFKIDRMPPNFRINNRILTGQEGRFTRNCEHKNHESKHIAKINQIKKLEERILALELREKDDELEMVKLETEQIVRDRDLAAR